MTATIRDAQRDDAPRVAALLAELGYPTDPDEVARRLDGLTRADALLIADDGLIALHRIPRFAEGGAFARITALVVAEGRRGDGVATALLAAAEARAREWGCDLLEVSSGRRPERDPAHRVLPRRRVRRHRRAVRAVLEALERRALRKAGSDRANHRVVRNRAYTTISHAAMGRPHRGVPFRAHTTISDAAMKSAQSAGRSTLLPSRS